MAAVHEADTLVASVVLGGVADSVVALVDSEVD